MEQVRMPPAQPQAAPKAPAAAGGHDAPQAGDAAPARKDGFALLLAALDGGAAQPLAAPESAALTADPLAGGQPAKDDTAADEAALALDLLGTGTPRPDAPDASSATGGKGGKGGKSATAPADAAQPALAPTDALAPVSLQEHLSMLLNQGRHTLAGQGLGPDSMVNETARIDAAVPPASGAGVRKAAGASAAALSARQALGGLAQAGASPVAAGVDAAAVSAGAGTGADSTANAVTAGQELLQAMLQKVSGGDARVSLHEGGAASAWAGTAPAPASPALALADAAAAAPHTRVASADGAQPHGGAGTGGEAGLPPAPLQPGGAASDLPGGAGPDAALPGSFMEQLGEQVAFWVHQKSQRAEFTLDRDGQPVQVQLSLSGDVAKVTFLTDHAAARQALDAGIEDLRERLQAQGLALADVNVGVAGGQSGGAPGQGAGSPPRREGAGGTARVEVPGQVAGASPRAVGQRGALDVFV